MKSGSPQNQMIKNNKQGRSQKGWGKRGLVTRAFILLGFTVWVGSLQEAIMTTGATPPSERNPRRGGENTFPEASGLGRTHD